MDIKAAFPSVLWSWVFFVLERMGCPWWLANAVKALYHGSSVTLSLGSTAGPGFLLSPGIKQGCPMSGGIWRLIFDPFIRALVFALRGLDASLFAFADDVGIPCGDLCECLSAVVPVLGLMSCAAGLALNWKKTVFINLPRYSDFEFRKRLSKLSPLVLLGSALAGGALLVLVMFVPWVILLLRRRLHLMCLLSAVWGFTSNWLLSVLRLVMISVLLLMLLLLLLGFLWGVGFCLISGCWASMWVFIISLSLPGLLRIELLSSLRCSVTCVICLMWLLTLTMLLCILAG